MVQYSDELKEEIRQANDIVDVVSQYVTLKRSGRNYFGLCPFHKEKSPSFSVSPDRQYYHCFGCNKGGDVFTFVADIEKISFKEAMEMLAERAKIELPTSDDPELNKRQYMRSRMYAINADTAIFYHERLYKPLAKIAQDYVKKRHLDNKTLKAFKIGYSGEYNDLYKFLKAKGYKDNEILATGLVNKNDRGEFIDRFRKRLMFPIMDVSGKVVAFGGRKLDENEKVAKYINSNENLVYSKKRHLFALNLAKQSDAKNIILVEGYMDAISLHQRGINNVVASLGTALTDEQARLLRKYSEQIILSYDSDGAGQEAIRRGIEILEAQGCDARVLQMEGAKDPDEYIIKYGTAKFNKLVENAISLTEFKIKMLKQKYNLDNPQDKVKFLREVTILLSKIDNSIEREIYIDKFALNYDISKDAIYSEVNKILYKKGKPKEEILDKKIPNLTKESEENQIDASVLKRENMIIYLLVNNPVETYNTLIEKISEDYFKNEHNKQAFSIIKSVEKADIESINKAISNIEDPDFQNHISEIMLSDYEITSIDKCVEDILSTYNRSILQEKKSEILKKLDDEKVTDEEKNQLMKELNDIIIKLANRK